jgi:UTP:GlnB (protein PII) uridylyltransferase
MHQSIDRYKAVLQKSREHWFCSEESGLSALHKVHSYTGDVDAVLIEIFNTFVAPSSGSAPVCLISLGGYGRGELCPYSDIDLLILHDEKKAVPEIAAAVRFFWDIGLTMGCVVRTIDECSSIVGQDLATDTAYLESRFLCGNKELYLRLFHSFIERYFAKKKNAFVKQMRRILHDELYSPETALYRIEPDIKNGICTLRDCHRLLWAERVRVGLSSMNDLHARSYFTEAQTRQFCADYEFLVGLRSRLHCVHGRRIDILETSVQPDVAKLCGFGPDGAGMLMERFFKTVREIRLLLLSYLEKGPTGANVWTNFRKRVSAVEASPGIAMCEGIFFTTHRHAEGAIDPVWIMTIFRQAMRYRATLSVALRNTIRLAAGRFTAENFKSQQVGALFREICSYEGNVGHVFQLMHETGTLSRVIPQFEDVICKVEYDSYHEFTVDQHILLMLVEADELSRDRDPVLAQLYTKCESKVVLRLGLLLHDLGKALPGDHVVNGAIIAETVCERLGLDDDESRRVRFLVYQHLAMSELCFRREPEQHVLDEFAAIVGDVKNLDMLYILTILDIRCVGRNTWTAWKAFQLEQLYKNVLNIVNSGTIAAPAGTSKNDDWSVSYERDTLPEDRRRHVEWLQSLAQGEMQLHCDRFDGFERITVYGWDRMGFLRDVIGCMSSEGYNILGAHIFSMPDGKVLDVFYVEPPQYPVVSSDKRLQSVRKKWESLINGNATADSLIGERLRHYPLKPLRRTVQNEADVQVNVDNESSHNTTIIEIKTADNFGLLHRIVQCLNKNDVNISSARLSTRVDQAVDVFYVTDAEGGKIDDELKTKRLIEELKEALGEKVGRFVET